MIFYIIVFNNNSIQGNAVTFKETMAGIFATAEGTYYKWKKENRPIINLLNYFDLKELQLFLQTGKISKLELIKGIDYKDLEQKLNEKSLNQNRLNEIIKIFTIYDTDTLKNALKEAFEKNNISFGTIEYLKQKRTKLEVIKKIENLLDDLQHEKQSNSRYISSVPNVDNDEKNQSYYEYEKAIADLNDKLGFDFSESDRVLVYNIISRYKVYNTLYVLDKAPKD